MNTENNNHDTKMITGITEVAINPTDTPTKLTGDYIRITGELRSADWGWAVEADKVSIILPATITEVLLKALAENVTITEIASLIDNASEEVQDQVRTMYGTPDTKHIPTPNRPSLMGYPGLGNNSSSKERTHLIDTPLGELAGTEEMCIEYASTFGWNYRSMTVKEYARYNKRD